jgi:asparagine synthase (glutamine-hydrolysing)
MESWAAHGAKHNLVYRYPLLDRRLLEFALSLPPEQYRRGTWSRWLMRNALQHILPRDICWNLDKSDGARVGNARPVVREGMARVGHQLAGRAAPPSRAGYVDYRRLVQHLTAEGLVSSGTPRFRNARAAVQLLDF